jgi:WD40 repeat protein
MPGHSGTVTCISVINAYSFVSADDTGEARIWKKTLGSASQACSAQYHVSIASFINDSNPLQWSSTKLAAHKQAISTLCVIDDYLATGSSDATVKLWKLPREGSDILALQTISLSGRYPLSMAFAYLPQSNSLCICFEVFSASEFGFRSCSCHRRNR